MLENDDRLLSVRQGTIRGESRERGRILGIGNCEGRSSYKSE